MGRVIAFRPPPLLPTRELDWVLARAFGPPKAQSVALAHGDRSRAVRLATELGLGPMIAHRTRASTLEVELGAEAAGALGRALLAQTARGLRRREVLAQFCSAAASVNKAVVVLKHAALDALGLAGPATRSAVDIDVLVRSSDLHPLTEAAAHAGFERDARWPSELHPLVVMSPAPDGVPIECHVSLPNVRPSDEPADATFEVLERAGLLRSAGAHPGSVLVPAEHVVAAHLVAHGLVQHRFTPDYLAMRLLADGAWLALDTNGDRARRAYRCVEHGVARDEYQALLELLGLLRRGARLAEIAERPQPARLLAHVVHSATDPVYRDSLVVARQQQRLAKSGLSAWLGHHARTALRPKRAAARSAYERAPHETTAGSVVEPLRTGIHLIRGVVALGRVCLRRATHR